MEITASLYETYGPYLDMTNLLADNFRLQLWSWVLGLMALLQGVETLYTDVDELFRGFFTNPLIGRLEGMFAVFFWTFMMIQGVILGYMMFVNPRMKYGNVFQAFFFAIVVVLIVPDVVSKGLDLADGGQVFVEEATSDGLKDRPLSEIVIRGNVYDVGQFMKDGWRTPPAELTITERNKLDSRQGIVLMNPVARVTDEMMEGDIDREILNYYWSTDLNEKAALDDGLFGIGGTKYYRYHIDFFPIFLQLVVLSFALLFVAFKTGMLLYEILLAQVLAPIAAAIGARESDTMRNIFTELAQKLLTLVILVLGFRLYLYFSTILFSTDRGWLVNIVVLFILTIGLFKGITYFDNKFGTRGSLREGVDMARAGGSVFTAPIAAGVGAMTGAAAVKRSAETLQGKKNAALPVPLKIDYGDSKDQTTSTGTGGSSGVASPSLFAKEQWKGDIPQPSDSEPKRDEVDVPQDKQATPDETGQSKPDSQPKEAIPSSRRRWKWQRPEPNTVDPGAEAATPNASTESQESEASQEPAEAPGQPALASTPETSETDETSAPALSVQTETNPGSETGPERGEADIQQEPPAQPDAKAQPAHAPANEVQETSPSPRPRQWEWKGRPKVSVHPDGSATAATPKAGQVAEKASPNEVRTPDPAPSSPPVTETPRTFAETVPQPQPTSPRQRPSEPERKLTNHVQKDQAVHRPSAPPAAEAHRQARPHRDDRPRGDGDLPATPPGRRG